jgi:hypothetical protein
MSNGYYIALTGFKYFRSFFYCARSEDSHLWLIYDWSTCKAVEAFKIGYDERSIKFGFHCLKSVSGPVF